MKNTSASIITPDLIATAMDYESYRNLVRNRIANNQSTGDDHSEMMVGFTSMNEKRMKRLDRTVKLLPEAISNYCLKQSQN